MFMQFFGLKDNPFKLTFDVNGFFLGKHHEEALAHLRYTVAEGEGFTVITGPNGIGKSTVCRYFIESLKSGAARVAFLSSPMIGPKELLQRMNRSFGIAVHAPSAHDLVHALNGFLMRERMAGRKVVVFIDDAQILAPAVLEQVRLISNLETTREKLIQIVLIGEPDLMQLLNSHQLRQMGQRVSVCYEIGPLTLDETAAYIQHRLSIASAGPPVRFSPEAVRIIFRHARGNPRRINIACSAMLAAAFKVRQRELTGELAQVVIQDIEHLAGGLGPVASPPRKRWPAWSIAPGAILLLSVAAFFGLRTVPAPPISEPVAPEPVAATAAAGEELAPPVDPVVEAEPAGPMPPSTPAGATKPPDPRPERPAPVKKPAMTHSVQIGAYLNPENAQQVAAQLTDKGYPARIMKITDARGRLWHTVRIGDHSSRQSAQAQADEFSRREQKQSVVRPFGAF